MKHKSIFKSIKNVVKNLISNNKETNGNTPIEHIPSDEVENHDLPKSVTEDADELRNVSQSTCGAWNQILCSAASVTIIF